jgi:hypothetical protein
MLLICADEATGAEHAMDGCDGWSEEMAERGVLLAWTSRSRSGCRG